MKKFTSYSDPGHSWLKVHKKWIMAAKLNGVTFSRFSYQSPCFAYLEEDCDAPKFIDWLRGHGVEVVLKSRHTNRESEIRKLPSLRYV